MDAIANIKVKIQKDYDIFMKSLEIGVPIKYDKILHEISFVNMYQVLDKVDPVYEYLINN